MPCNVVAILVVQDSCIVRGIGPVARPDGFDQRAIALRTQAIKLLGAQSATAIAQLQDAVARGLLTADEGSERMAVAYAARYLTELPRLTADLYGAAVLGLTEHDLVYSVAKLFFAYGLGNALTFPLAVGATTVLMPGKPTPEAVAALLRRYPVTVLFGVPTFYAAFLASAAAPAVFMSLIPG